MNPNCEKCAGKGFVPLPLHSPLRPGIIAEACGKCCPTKKVYTTNGSYLADARVDVPYLTDKTEKRMTGKAKDVTIYRRDRNRVTNVIVQLTNKEPETN